MYHVTQTLEYTPEDKHIDTSKYVSIIETYIILIEKRIENYCINDAILCNEYFYNNHMQH